MSIFRVELEYVVCGVVFVEADDEKEAESIAIDESCIDDFSDNEDTSASSEKIEIKYLAEIIKEDYYSLSDKPLNSNKTFDEIIEEAEEAAEEEELEKYVCPNTMDLFGSDKT